MCPQRPNVGNNACRTSCNFFTINQAFSMPLHRLFCALGIACALLLGACTPQDTAPADKSAPKAAVSVADIARQAKGFTVGALMSNTVVYVFFDPQCPHCGHLWQASLPLHRKVKFVWIPVSWINASSLSQGAALLTASNPTEAMTEHETLLVGGKGAAYESTDV